MADIREHQAAAKTISVVTQKKSSWKLRTVKRVPDESLPEKKLKLIASNYSTTTALTLTLPLNQMIPATNQRRRLRCSL